MINGASSINTQSTEVQGSKAGKTAANNDLFASMLAKELSSNAAYMETLTKATSTLTSNGTYDGTYAAALQNMSIQEATAQKKAESVAIANVRAALAAGVTAEEEAAEGEEAEAEDGGLASLFGGKEGMRDALLLMCLMMSAGSMGGDSMNSGMGGSMNSGAGLMISSLASAMSKVSKK